MTQYLVLQGTNKVIAAHDSVAPTIVDNAVVIENSKIVHVSEIVSVPDGTYDPANGPQKWNGTALEPYAPVDETANRWDDVAPFRRGEVLRTIRATFSPSKAKKDAFIAHAIYAELEDAPGGVVDTNDPRVRTILDKGLAELVADEAQWSDQDVTDLINAMPKKSAV